MTGVQTCALPIYGQVDNANEVLKINSTGIKKEAVLVGLLDRFEIWSPVRYAEVRSDDQVMAGAAFSLME